MDESLAQPTQPGFAVLTLEKAHEGNAAVAERGDECLEWRATVATGGEIDPHCLPGRASDRTTGSGVGCLKGAR